MANFEGYERRIGKIEKVLAEYGFKDLDEVKAYTQQKGVDAESIVRGIQPIAFENACWAYTLGAAIALKKGCTKAADAAEAIGIGLQAFCIPGLGCRSEKRRQRTRKPRSNASSQMRQSASVSWQDTNPLQQQRARLESQERLTRLEKSPFALS